MKRTFLALCMAVMMLFSGCQTSEEKELTLPSYDDVLLETEHHSWGGCLTANDEEISHYIAKYFFSGRTTMEGCFFLAVPGESIDGQNPEVTPTMLECVLAVDYETSSGTILLEQLLLQFNKIDGALSDVTVSCQGHGVIPVELDENNFTDVELDGVSGYNSGKKVQTLGLRISGTLTYEDVEYPFDIDF